MFKRMLLLGLTWLAVAVPAVAQTPAPLKPWEEWASAPFAYRDCAIKPGAQGGSEAEYACQWPGKLELHLSSNAGSFQQSWSVDQKGFVILPGSSEAWPQQVRVDGSPAPVVERDGAPVVQLLPGRHVVQGQWEWDKLPSRLAIPSQTAWWSVDRPGKGSSRREGAALLLEDAQVVAGPSTTRDTVNLRVFRKWTDGQVPQVDVRLQLNVGGAPRELVLGPVVDPAQWQVMGLDSPWPVQWEPDGKLRVQVQPGSSALSLRLRCVQHCQEAFSRPHAVAPWPQVEYWALESNPAFRIVAWEGEAVDPRQVAAPQEWQSLPWVVVRDKASARWVVKSRGPAEKDAALTMSRTGWLDFQGGAWWLVDDIQGQTPRAYRINALAPYKMVAASSNGRPLLVSQDKGTTGMEWRAPNLLAQVVLRQDGRAPELPIAGVDGEFSQVNWTLHFPAGYQVLFAPGVDSADQVWWNRWRLTQVLGVALLLLLSWRWGGWRAFVPSALLILLAYHAPGMPLWSWGFVLGFGLLAHAGLPDRLRRKAMIAWYVVLGVWILLAAFFAIFQVRAAMYPNWVDGAQSRNPLGALVENRVLTGQSGSMEAGVYQQVGEAAPAPAQDAAVSAEMEMKARAMSSNMGVISSSRPSAPPAPVAPPPRAIEETGVRIGAGPGLPQWQSNHPVSLSWQGPITAKDTVKLWVAGPFLVGLGRWLSVVLLVLVGWSFVRRPAVPEKLFPGFKAPWKKALAASLLCVALPSMAQAPSVSVAPSLSSPDQATPVSDWMDRLGQEKHPVPECAPQCIGIASARLSGGEGQLVVELEAHAQARAALPLPVDAEQALVLASVQQDGVALPAVMQQGDQQWLQLAKGVSHIRLVFVPRAASGTLRFTQSPGRIEASAAGWSFSGIDKQRLGSGVLGWQRTSASVATATDKEQPKVEVAVAPFVQVNRTIVFGPKWEVETQVVRIAPTTGAFVVSVPLLAGEQPRQDLPRDGKGALEVSFPAGQNIVSWSSDLPAKTQLLLSAPSSVSSVERWTLSPGTRFRVAVQGVVPMSNDAWSFQPLPGEKLAITVSEPKPVEGATVAIDQASVVQQWGPRGQAVALDFQARATTATDLVLHVPSGLDLVEIRRAGALVPGLRVEGGKLLLPTPPGSTPWNVSFRNNQAPSLRVASPQFKFDAPVANLTLVHIPGAKRWVLDTQGPGKAPAVAYWPWLVVLIVLALLLGRWKHSPLKTWQWVLLGLGFSVAAPWKIALVGGWLVALNQRSLRSQSLHASPWFNPAQALLVAWTLLAVSTIVGALPESLLASPDMKIYGQMGDRLPWFIDQVASGQSWPQAVVVSLPIWVYRALMLAWSLWLAISALNWLRDGLRAWLQDGHWHALPKRVPPPVVPPARPAE